MLIAQNNCCAICSTIEPGFEHFCVDHDHVTDKVRGLLCHDCNTGIGTFGDNLRNLQRVAEYFRRDGLDVREALKHPQPNTESTNRTRENTLRKNFGISHADYVTILYAQNGSCAICASDNPGTNRKYFPVDHDHIAGHVRGLLCFKCNVGLGLLKDSLNVVLKAITYLKKYDGEK